MPLPSPEVRFFLAQIARRERTALKRIQFQLGGRQFGRDSYGPFTTYPGDPGSPHHLTQGVLGSDNLLDGAQRGIQNPPIP